MILILKTSYRLMKKNDNSEMEDDDLDSCNLNNDELSEIE